MVEAKLLNLLVFVAIFLKTEGLNVSITYVDSAVAEGAVCLDGSPPAYHFQEGSDVGNQSWLVHFEGGGWCDNVTTCLQRKNTRLGSSRQMAKSIAFSGILSSQQTLNPDFYTWNKVMVRYCDGASFTGDVEAVDPDTNLYFRGARVFRAVIKDLIKKGMNNAENAIISGCSAGGLTSILHCDSFKTLLPASANVKCLADAGYFINAKDVSGARHIEAFYEQVVTTHGSAQSLHPLCTREMRPALCFFPEKMVQYIKTPLFILNAAYDSWQIRNILVPGVADPRGSWEECKYDFEKCSECQLQTIQDFRGQFLKALPGVGTSSTTGMFIDACNVHCQSETQGTWLSMDSPLLGNTTIAKAVGDWYYDRRPFQKIDCPYPCNPTCPVLKGLSSL